MLGSLERTQFFEFIKVLIFKDEKMNQMPKITPHEDATALIWLQITS